jgi:hypothetical protein
MRTGRYPLMTVHHMQRPFLVILILATVLGSVTPRQALSAWTVGKPIVAYWNGPGTLLWGEHFGPLDDAAAKQVVSAGFNVALANSCEDVQLAQSHGLRTLFQSELLTPASLDGGPKQAALDALIKQLCQLPAHYGYMLKDEPTASEFAGLGRLMAYLRQHDPDHVAHINLLPNYANNTQLGANGYDAYLDQFVKTVRPAILNYDHYQFATTGDTPEYLHNLELVAQCAKRAGVPFLNTVQSCSWDKATMRVPTANETRYLVYSTLAYGAQGIFYFQYGPAELGGIVQRDGTPFPIFPTLQTLNREFVAVASQYQRLTWIGVYLKGYRADALPPGTKALPTSGSPFNVSNVSDIAYSAGAPLKGILLGFFDTDGAALSDATFTLVTNLDYSAEKTCRVTGPGNLSVFSAATGTWTPQDQNHVDLTLPPGGGVLVGVTSVVPKTND